MPGPLPRLVLCRGASKRGSWFLTACRAKVQEGLAYLALKGKARAPTSGLESSVPKQSKKPGHSNTVLYAPDSLPNRFLSVWASSPCFGYKSLDDRMASGHFAIVQATWLSVTCGLA